MLLNIFNNKGKSELTSSDYRKVFDDNYEGIRNFIYFKTSNMKFAEDIAQDTFVKLWENRAKIEMSTVKSYLYTIANNLTINQLKRQQLQYKFQKQVDHAYENNSPDYLLQMKEFEAKLQGVISSIPDGSREVFLMNRIEGLKYREIAERLGISVKAVEKRMSKALQIIRNELGVNI